ncbi:MAG: hypothetical protein DWQ37_14095 [Planctomycetota bacterium]|nr:MAG: hypothetical protein DWQ37_14095 [Planctomycetota bacterium]
MTRYACFDRQQIALADLAERGHDLHAADCKPLDARFEPYRHPEFADLVDRLVRARRERRPVILMMGAHAIKLGLSRYLVDLIERDLVTHVATNGAGIIHDFELAAGGGTSEDVSKWIARGQFGLWQQTSRLNDVVLQAANRREGLGEAAGRTIEEKQFPFRHLSIAAAGWRHGVPVTSHVGIGSDIIHSHPNCDGAALGAASYTDFLIFAHSVSGLEGGVFLNVGSAVTGPEVYLKALSMARNVAHQRGQRIADITTGVFDLVDLPSSFRQGPPGKDHPLYYYRPWKTILVRTVADGGQSYYFSGDLRSTLPTLWHNLTQAARRARAA